VKIAGIAPASAQNWFGQFSAIKPKQV